MQTQFPQAQTQRLQSTSVSAPSAYVSSSRAHSVGTRNKGQQFRVKVEYSILAGLGTLPFFPDKTYLASEAPYLSKCYHPPKDLGTRTFWGLGQDDGLGPNLESWEGIFLAHSGEFHQFGPPQNAPTPYKSLFLRLSILFSGGLKDGLRHLRNSWKLSFQSAFSSDSSMRASTQSPLK